MGKPGILKNLQMLAATLKSVKSSTDYLTGGLVKWMYKCSNFLFRNQLQIKISRQKKVLDECYGVFIAPGTHRKAAKGMSESGAFQWVPPITTDLKNKKMCLAESETVRRAIGEAWQKRKCHFKECTVLWIVSGSPAISIWWKSPEKWSHCLWYCEVALGEVTQVESRLIAYTNAHWHVHIWRQMHIASWNSDSYLPV